MHFLNTCLLLKYLYSFLSFIGFSDYDENEEEKPSTHVPRLMSTSIAVEATLGEPVTFPCDVDDLGNVALKSYPPWQLIFNFKKFQLIMFLCNFKIIFKCIFMNILPISSFSMLYIKRVAHTQHTV